VDLNGKVALKDIILLNKYLSKMVSLNETQLKAAECKSDGTVDNQDLIALMRYLVDLETSLPIA
jgi:hypothetical protein